MKYLKALLVAVITVCTFGSAMAQDHGNHHVKHHRKHHRTHHVAHKDDHR